MIVIRGGFILVGLCRTSLKAQAPGPRHAADIYLYIYICSYILFLFIYIQIKIKFNFVLENIFIHTHIQYILLGPL